MNLTPCHKIPTFITCIRSLLKNIVGKGENAGNQHFLLSHNVFYLSKTNFIFFSHIYFFPCSNAFNLDQSEKFVVWYGVNVSARSVDTCQPAKSTQTDNGGFYFLIATWSECQNTSFYHITTLVSNVI